MKITDAMRREYHREYEDFQFGDDLLDMEVSVDGPIPHPADEAGKTPNLVVEVRRVSLASGLEITGEAADAYYSLEQVTALLDAIVNKFADEAERWDEQRRERY